MKALKLFTSFAFLLVVLITACKKDDPIDIKGENPVVLATSPTNIATTVSLNQMIAVSFNEEMNAASFNKTSFTVQGLTPVEGNVSYSGTTATFIPANELGANTTYTVRVSSSVQNVSGESLPNDHVWTFSTGSIISPAVISMDPKNNSTGIVLNKIIAANFSMPMDPSTINETSFIISQGANAVPGIITYEGTKAIFNPSVDLTPNTVYTATITGVRNTSGTALANDHNSTFTTASSSAPAMTSTEPENNATSVDPSKVVTATFSAPMNPLTFNSTNFSISQGANAIPGSVSYTGTTATFKPLTALKPNTTYTARVVSLVKDLNGNPLQNDYLWYFSTGATLAPAVISIDPSNNAIGVVLNKIVNVRFSMPMNSSTITPSTFNLQEGSNSVTGTVSYIGNIASFIPSSPLRPNTTYTGNITTDAQNGSGVAMANDYIWSFRTVSLPAPAVISTEPQRNATQIASNRIITAHFSVPMDPSTINASTFTLREGASQVNGTVSYTGTVASFTPAISLNPNTVYTATITSQTKNLAGAVLSSDFVWNFTTEADKTAPTVISSDPANNATGVEHNKIITASFSMPIDPLSIDNTSFILRQGSTPVVGSVLLSNATASFTPSTALTPNTVYTMTITNGVKNLTGVSLANNYVASFTTKP